jgi:hypothetical protein
MTGLGRGRHHAISPFFAFQDIITSAIAVLITIVLLLAVSLGESASTVTNPQIEVLRQTLYEKLTVLQAENEKVKLWEASAAGALRDPALLKSQVDALREELSQLLTSTAKDKKTVDSILNASRSRIAASELARQNNELENAKGQFARLQEQASASLQHMKTLQAQVQDAENARLAQEALKNRLSLIPDRTQTDKEPVLIVVQDQTASVQTTAAREVIQIATTHLKEEMLAALKHFKTTDHFIVFYFKPSGAKHFEAVVSVAKSAGFEVGYNTIPESIQLQLGPL